MKKHTKEVQADCFWDFEGLLKGKYKWYIDETLPGLCNFMTPTICHKI